VDGGPDECGRVSRVLALEYHALGYAMSEIDIVAQTVVGIAWVALVLVGIQKGVRLL
jgi:hypothetical protein